MGERTTYGHSLELLGFGKYSVSGCSSPLEAEARVYSLFLQSGWKPPPLRQRWWQIWRPTKYDAALSAAIEALEKEGDVEARKRRDRTFTDAGKEIGADFDVEQLQSRMAALEGALTELLDACAAHNTANDRQMIDPHAEVAARAALTEQEPE